MKGQRRWRWAVGIVVTVGIVVVMLMAYPVAIGIAVMRLSMMFQGYEHNYADLDGYRLSYFEKNPTADRTTILIHGLADQAGTWWLTGSALEGQHVIAVDLPGHGDSGPVDGPITMEHLQQMMTFLLSQTPHHVTLVGNSLGGFVALRMAIDRPDRIDRLVAIDAGGMQMSLAKETFLPQTREQMADTMFRVTGPNMLQPPGPLLDDMRASILSGPTPRIWGALSAADPIEGELGRIRARTLVVWGTEDRLIPIALGRRMAAAIPGADFMSIPGCGHSPQATCPDELVPILAPFLAAEEHEPKQP
ncbi:MAG: alpha/beta hydrolase [bacterium]